MSKNDHFSAKISLLLNWINPLSLKHNFSFKIIQSVYNETTLFWRCFEKRQTFFSGVKGLLHTTGVQIPS
jgi:hypothetical protein